MSDPENDTFLIEEGADGMKGLPNFTILHVLMGFQAVLCISGSLLHPLVIYLYGRRDQMSTYLYSIIVLAWKDFIACAVFLPINIILEAVEFRIYNDFLCKLFHYAGFSAFSFSYLMFLIMALERCVCVCFSKRYTTRTSVVKMVIAGCVIVSLVQSAPASLIMGVYAQSNGTHFEIVNVGYCHGNNLLISLRYAFKYLGAIKYEPVVTALIEAGVYFAILLLLLYRKYKSPNQLSHSGTSSENKTATEASDGENNPDSQTLIENQNISPEEQVRWTRIYFVITFFFFGFQIPALLIAFGSIRPHFYAFHIYQLHFISNPIILICMDSSFRAEVKDFIRSKWYEIFG